MEEERQAAALEEGIAAACREGRLGEAARLASDGGDHARAARLYEQACEFAPAAEQAVLGGDYADAMRLGVLSRDGPLCSRISSAFVAAAPAERVRKAAADLAARGAHRQAAALLLGVGDREQAAQAFEQAGCATEAARAYEAAGQPAPAARILEAALKSGREADPDALRALLAELYARHGKHQAAVRVAQQIAESSDARSRAVAVLARSLEALGLSQARRDLDAEIASLGVELTEPENPAPAESAAEQAVLFGRYRITREVAMTPHARLLDAIDQLSGERVAVKVLAARARGTGRDALQRFVREARALTQLRHPNVVPLREFVMEGPAMVLKWMGGGSLEDLLERESLTPRRSAEIARAVLDALAEAHRLGILHRDIKPSNLLFDEGGAARLADFGAAHMSESEATVTVGAIGTVAYMSPEQRAGHAATVKSDLYGVGVMLHEMLSGELPPPRRPVTLVGVHPDLEGSHDAVINQLIAHDPANRFADAFSARRAIEAINWSTRATRTARGPRSAPEIEPVDDGATLDRLAPPTRGGDRHDRWLGRDIYIQPFDERTLVRAAAFARADHPALPTVLRADAEAKQIWVEVAAGRPLSQGLALEPGHHADLEAALAALHSAGGVHGSVDDHHVYLHAGRARLAFPRHATAATADDDRAALLALRQRR